MNDPQTTWERYVASWKEPARARKRELFASCLSPTCVYTDPLKIAAGWEELADYMADLERQVPGAHFVTEQFIAHHARSIARWRMVAGDGATVGAGISYGEYDDDGKLLTMTGFFETPVAPPA